MTYDENVYYEPGTFLELQIPLVEAARIGVGSKPVATVPAKDTINLEDTYVRLGIIDSFDKILDRRGVSRIRVYVNWMEKIAKMPARNFR